MHSPIWTPEKGSQLKTLSLKLLLHTFENCQLVHISLLEHQKKATTKIWTCELLTHDFPNIAKEYVCIVYGQ